MAEVTQNEYLLYKGKPLVKCGKELYYGSMADKYIIHIEIVESKDVDGVDTPTKLAVRLMYTDEDIRLKDRIIKTSEKDSLFRAIEIGSIWLERALSK